MSTQKNLPFHPNSRKGIKYVSQKLREKRLENRKTQHNRQMKPLQNKLIWFKEHLLDQQSLTEEEMIELSILYTKRNDEELEEMITTITNNLKEDKRNRALLVAKGDKLVSELGKTEEAMKKARAKYVDARKKQDRAQEGVQKAKASGSSITKLQKAAEKDERRADKADNEYRISVKNLKLAQDKFHDQDMPALLRDFEVYEEKRLKHTQDYFQTFVGHETPLGPNTSAFTERFGQKVKSINIKGDLELYVTQNRPDSEPPARITYVSYDGSVVQDVNGSGAPVASSSGVLPSN